MFNRLPWLQTQTGFQPRAGVRNVPGTFIWSRMRSYVSLACLLVGAIVVGCLAGCAGGFYSMAPQPPAAPVLTATAGNAQVNLSWMAVAGATSYNLYYSTSNGVTTATGTKISGVTATSYTQTGLTNGTTYYYVLTAVDANGESAASNQASATPFAPVTIPTAPTTLTATAGNAQVVTSWTASAGAATYNLYYSTTAGVTPATGTKISGLTTTTYTQTGLTNGTTYYYVVTAVDSAGESVASNQASATPFAPVTVPTAPTTLTATAGNAQVVTSWTASAGAATYNLYYSTTAGVTPATGTKISGLTTTTYTQTGLTNGTTYYYVVTAVDSAGESAASNQASATPTAPLVPPSAPTLTATAGNAQVITSWTAPTGATSYNLYYSTTSGVTTATGTKISGITATTYTQTGLTNGTTYYYVVTAVGGGGESVASNQASATPSAPALSPPTLTSVTPGNTQAVAVWTSVAGATSYNLYYSTTSPVAIGSATKVGSITGTTYTVTGLNNCSTYYFAVTAVAGSSETVLSNQISASPVSPTSVALTPGTAGSLTLAGANSSSLTFNFPTNAVSAKATVSLTAYTQAQLPVPFTQSGATVLTGFGVCVVPSITSFGAPVTITGTAGSTASGTQLNLALAGSSSYTDVATFLVGASAALTEGIPTVALPGLTTAGTFALYQPAAGNNTTVANYGIAVYADDSTAYSKSGVNVVHFFDSNGNVLTTPTVQFIAIAGIDLDGQAITPDASVSAVIDGGNTVHFIKGIQNGTPADTGVTLDVSAYGGDGDSVVMLPNGDEAIVTADNGGPLVYISGILANTPVIASTISNGTGTTANGRDGLVISNDGTVMLARGDSLGTSGIDVYSITSIPPTAGTLTGTVTHKFTLTKTLLSFANTGGTVAAPFLEDGRDAMSMSPVDSSRALIGGYDASFNPVLQLLTGLPSAPVAGPTFSLPSSFEPVAVAISPDGTMAVIGGGYNSNGLYLVKGVNTGNLQLVGSLYTPSYTLPATNGVQPAGTVVQLMGVTTVGFSLDGKYVIAGDNANRAVIVVPVSASGFGAAPVSVYCEGNMGVPFNDQMVVH